MRNRATLITVAVALFVATFAPAALAWPMHGSFLAAVVCPQGTGLGDGCPQSTGGTFLAVSSPNQWSAYARTTGQTWAAGAHPWTWNAPGIDYSIGPWTPIAQLKDPATASLPAGCSYNSTGNAIGGPLVSCSGSINPTISGFDFGPNANHGCVQLILFGDVKGQVTIIDNRFKNGTGCSNNDATIIGTLSSSATSGTKTLHTTSVVGTIVLGRNIQGGDIDRASTIDSSLGGGDYSVTIGRCNNGGSCDTDSQTYNTGRTLDYVLRINQFNTFITGVLIQNNTFDGDGTNFPMTFGFAFMNTGMQSGNLVFLYNNFVRIPTRPVNIPQQGGSEVFKFNYFEDICYNEIDDHCEPWFNILQAGNSLDLTQVSYNVFLSGKTGIWPGGTALVWIGTGNGSPVVTNTQVDHNIFVANCVANGPSGTANPTSNPCTSDFYAFSGGGTKVLSTSRDIAMQDRTYTNTTFTSNLFDSTGAFTRSVAQGGGIVCTNPTVWSGNFDLVTGLAVTALDATGGGC